MSSIEITILLLLLIMGVPDLCRKLGRPALAYTVFVVMGMVLRPITEAGVTTMLTEAGRVGFLLLLFEVGLEIDLPPFRQFRPALRQAMGWVGLQFPVGFALAGLGGLGVGESLLAAAALTGCSVSMAHPAWKEFPFRTGEGRSFVLQIMVALEMLSILAMAVATTGVVQGVSGWIVVRLLGIAVVVYGLARFAARLGVVFQWIIERATHWRLHWLALLILSICALGERVGLDAAKTAFVLGLCLRGARGHGLNVEEHLAPLSRRFLIPLFFVSLGMHVEWTSLSLVGGLTAMGAAGLLLGIREVVHRRWLGRVTEQGPVYLLLSPNLTLVALAATVLLDHGRGGPGIVWLLVTGLLMTVPSIALLPARDGADQEAGGGEGLRRGE